MGHGARFPVPAVGAPCLELIPCRNVFDVTQLDFTQLVAALLKRNCSRSGR